MSSCRIFFLFLWGHRQTNAPDDHGISCTRLLSLTFHARNLFSTQCFQCFSARQSLATLCLSQTLHLSQTVQCRMLRTCKSLFPCDARYFPVNAGSVPFSLNILYCSGVSFFFHSSSDFGICFMIKRKINLLI